MMLAINGGDKVRKKLFPAQETIGEEEKNAVNQFLNNNKILSGYRGNYIENFWGGEYVQKLEKEFIKTICGEKSDRLALAVNSCTSALQIACGAIGLKPGDEVIVTPWSMTCSATAPMVWGATPVFADIEEDYFCLDPESIKSKITEKTKAIIVVDLFGQPYDSEAINKIADDNGLYIIEDAAQAIGSNYVIEEKIEESIGFIDEVNPAGSLGHIGCFSFTQGKHLTCGEGGMIVASTGDLATKCAMIRNHAEAVCNDMDEIDRKKYQYMYGFNMRMTEIQAVILLEQLKKLNSYVKYRRVNQAQIVAQLSDIEFIKPTKQRKNCRHCYYVAPFKFNEAKAGIHRDKFIDAVRAELTEEEGRIDRGIPITKGYIKPIYKMPLFEQRYSGGLRLPVVERLQNDEFFGTLYHGLNLSLNDIRDISEAFHKVANNLEELK